MKNLEIETLNLVQLSNEDMSDIYGGGWKRQLWDWTIGYVVGEVIDGVGRGLATPCTPCSCK